MADYDAQFEAEVLAHCLKDAKYLREAARVLDRRHFILREHGWAWRVIRETWTRATELCTPAVFQSRATADFQEDEDRRVHLELVLRLYKHAQPAPRTALEELRRFVRTAALQSAIEDSVRAQERGEWDQAWEPIQDLMRKDVRRTGYSVGRWIEEFEERQRERKHRREHPEQYRSIPTGFRRLDRVITGAQEGELCGIMATTNRGKSALAVNIGFNAVMRKFSVIHFSTEMGYKKVLQRYDSRFTEIEYRKYKRFDFTEEELADLDKLILSNKRKFIGRLRVVSTPLRTCDIDLIRTAIEDLRLEMPSVDMVIVDSGDHLQPRGRFEKQYLAEGSNFYDLKDLAEDLEIPVWVTLQAKQEFETKVASTRAAGGAYAKSQVVDLMLSLNEPGEKPRARAVTSDTTRIEAPTKKPDLELYVAKCRDDESKFFIPIETDLKRMLIREMESMEG